MQLALHEPGCLPKAHPKQDLQRHTGLNGRVPKLQLPTALAARSRRPSHLGIKPNRQRSALFHAVNLTNRFVQQSRLWAIKHPSVTLNRHDPPKFTAAILTFFRQISQKDSAIFKTK